MKSVNGERRQPPPLLSSMSQKRVKKVTKKPFASLSWKQPTDDSRRAVCWHLRFAYH
ncbi:hypothetical protein [Phocaeicola dorei]|uniref:hypothetical protein n=1 Tax=Phocaeicola dorei TaxID=357276 RepID=UPI001F2761D9|nr:hypothetical protein [Phocaeicola dorei]